MHGNDNGRVSSPASFRALALWPRAPPQGLGIIIGSGYPEKQVLALFSPVLDPGCPRSSSLWSLDRFPPPSAVLRDPSSVSFARPGRVRLGRGLGHLWGAGW